MRERKSHRAGTRSAIAEVRGLAAGCPTAALLEMLARPWTMHILWLLTANGPMRFGALQKSAEGISARLLTIRLRTLEREGLVERTTAQGKPGEVVYSPTARCADLNEVMTHLQRVSERWRVKDTS